ncbi:MAG: MFS transporter [Clostridia bacterium]|nr:MFS transporter [Clostridia bacterium]
MTKKARVSALSFILIMGVVSMFSDMTHEGARSIYGAYLSLAGASAAAIGFVSGLGEFVGYAFRLIAGPIADRKKNYWVMTLVGYSINMLAIPALALVHRNGWILASILIVAERMGKAIRYPAKNTLVSFAAAEVGPGKSFAIQEFLDQLGAFLGPVILFAVMALRDGSDLFRTYAVCFAVLAVPAFITLLLLVMAKRKFPHPENFDKSPGTGKLAFPKSFVWYLAGISLLALGFADFPIITMHVSRLSLVSDEKLPLLYAAAMAVDAFAALFFGWLFDRIGVRVLMITSLLSSAFAVFIFLFSSLPAVVLGVVLWGIGMGAQESVVKSTVSVLAPKAKRSTGFGIVETGFGLFWFLGSWLIGILYDVSLPLLVAFSVSTQLAAVPVFWMTYRSGAKKTAA